MDYGGVTIRHTGVHFLLQNIGMKVAKNLEYPGQILGHPGCPRMPLTYTT